MENKYTILIVEAESDIIATLYDTFSDRYKILRADNLNEALEFLSNNSVDLVISDNSLPELSGTELFSVVENKYPKIEKILLIDYAELESAVKAVNKGPVSNDLTKSREEKEVMHILLELLNVRLKQSVEERKMIEAQMLQASKMASIGELAAGIAHELNNPLGFIHANLGNMDKFLKKILRLVEGFGKIGLSKEQMEKVLKIKDEMEYEYVKKRILELINRSRTGSERMKKIITGIKNLSRIDSAEVAEADINDAIETTLSLMINEYKNRIKIIKEYGDIPLIECYISKINQVIMNLLINACYAIEGKGEIRVKTFIENEDVNIEISDTGKGIPEEIRSRIFDPFFTTKPVGVGTGLGLSISYGIIKQHKGKLSVENKRGKGAKFRIKLPLHMDIVKN